MKKYLLAFALSILTCTSLFANPIDRLGIVEPLQFNNTKFKIAYSSKPNDSFYLQEYLPNKESLER